MNGTFLRRKISRPFSKTQSRFGAPLGERSPRPGTAGSNAVNYLAHPLHSNRRKLGKQRTDLYMGPGIPHVYTRLVRRARQ